MRNWVTPSRSHRSHASSGDSGSGAGSRSSTVTSWPSRCSISPAASPHTPAPAITIRATPATLTPAGVCDQGAHERVRALLRDPVRGARDDHAGDVFGDLAHHLLDQRA